MCFSPTIAYRRLEIDLRLVFELQDVVLDGLHLRNLQEIFTRTDSRVLVSTAYEDVATVLERGLRSQEGQQARMDMEPVARQLVMEMTFCRMVDSLQAYLTEIFVAVAQRQPNILKSGEKVSFERVLSFNTHAEMIAGLAEMRIDDVSRQGYQHLIRFVSERLGAAAFDDDEQKNRLSEYVDLRNLFTHHRGRVDRRFAERWGLESGRIGEVYPLRYEFVRRAVVDIQQVGLNIDRLAVRKFGVSPATDATD